MNKESYLRANKLSRYQISNTQSPVFSHFHSSFTSLFSELLFLFGEKIFASRIFYLFPPPLFKRADLSSEQVGILIGAITKLFINCSGGSLFIQLVCPMYFKFLPLNIHLLALFSEFVHSMHYFPLALRFSFLSLRPCRSSDASQTRQPDFSQLFALICLGK